MISSLNGNCTDYIMVTAFLSRMQLNGKCLNDITVTTLLRLIHQMGNV